MVELGLTVLLALNRVALGAGTFALVVAAVAVLAYRRRVIARLQAATAHLPDSDPSFEVIVPPGAARAIALVLLVVVLGGVALRFVELDRQIFWDDEIWTGLRIGGIGDDRIAALYDGRTLTVAQLDAILHTRAASLAPVIRGLAAYEPQWPPLFFALEWVWSGIFGTSAVALRVLAAIFGAALVPVAYWLGFELFRARAPAWLAASLVALSPGEIVYAREARGYSLLLLIAALSMAMLLYALRTRRMAPWYGFAALSILGLYDYVLYAAILGGELAYVFIAERFRWTAPARAATIAAAIAMLAFAPWAVVSVRARTALASGLPITAAHYSPLFHAGKLLLNVATTFFATTYFQLDAAPVAVVVALIVVLLAVAVARVAPRAALALACFGLPTVLVLLAWDIVLNKHLLLIYRYDMPAWLALQLAAAGGLTWGVARSTGAARAAWCALGVVLLIAEGTSSALAVGQTTFWDSWYDAGTAGVASAVNALPHPLIIAVHDSDDIFTFAAALRPDVRIRFSKPGDYSLPPSSGASASDVVLLSARAATPRGWHGAPLRALYTFDSNTSLVVRLRQRYHSHWLAYGVDPFVGADTVWEPSTQGSAH